MHSILLFTIDFRHSFCINIVFSCVAQIMKKNVIVSFRLLTDYAFHWRTAWSRICYYQLMVHYFWMRLGKGHGRGWYLTTMSRSSFSLKRKKHLLFCFLLCLVLIFCICNKSVSSYSAVAAVSFPAIHNWNKFIILMTYDFPTALGTVLMGRLVVFPVLYCQFLSVCCYPRHLLAWLGSSVLAI